MSEYPRLVHWSYFDGKGLFSKGNSKEILTEVYITNEKGEEVLEGGKVTCLNNGLFSTVDDPYFKVTKREGFTRRAKKFGDMRRTMEKNHPELKSRLTGFKGRVMEYGEYVYFDLAHVDNYVNPIVKEIGYLHNKNFVPKDKFHKDFLLFLIEYRPLTLMDRQLISGYHRNELPAFFAEVKIKFPELYNEVLEESEWLQKLDEDLTYVGKKAKVKTLSSGRVLVELTFLESSIFDWDGETLTNEKETRDGETVSQMIKPSDNMVVEIVDDGVVNEDTELAD